MIKSCKQQFLDRKFASSTVDLWPARFESVVTYECYNSAKLNCLKHNKVNWMNECKQQQQKQKRRNISVSLLIWLYLVFDSMGRFYPYILCALYTFRQFKCRALHFMPNNFHFLHWTKLHAIYTPHFVCPGFWCTFLYLANLSLFKEPLGNSSDSLFVGVRMCVCVCVYKSKLLITISVNRIKNCKTENSLTKTYTHTDNFIFILMVWFLACKIFYSFFTL